MSIFMGHEPRHWQELLEAAREFRGLWRSEGSASVSAGRLIHAVDAFGADGWVSNEAKIAEALRLLSAGEFVMENLREALKESP